MTILIRGPRTGLNITFTWKRLIRFHTAGSRNLRFDFEGDLITALRLKTAIRGNHFSLSNLIKYYPFELRRTEVI